MVLLGSAPTNRETGAMNSPTACFFGLVLIQIKRKMLVVLKSPPFSKTTTLFCLARSSSRCHQLSEYSVNRI